MNAAYSRTFIQAGGFYTDQSRHSKGRIPHRTKTERENYAFA
jgi:hypothetical protein